MCRERTVSHWSATGWVGLAASVALNSVVLGQGASRVLPGYFEPGVTFPVAVVLDVPPGILAAGVEDAPPVGWAVSNVSPGGTFDTSSMKVKWGPFFAPSIPAQVSYELTPPPDASLEAHCFDGTASYNGFDYPIAGDGCMDSLQCMVHTDCDDDDVCTRNRCIGGVCSFTANDYGDVDGNGSLTLADAFCILDGFAGDFTHCSFEQDDIHGSCGPDLPACCPDGSLGLGDVFAFLGAFGGVDPCCGG